MPRPPMAPTTVRRALRGAAVAADHLAEVIGVDPDLQHAPAAQVARSDLHLVGVVDDALHEVLKGLLEHPQASVDSADSA
ncbi:hypothetical protein GCM10020000_22650 [Streptomyces olivoverticillatus]